MSVSEYSSSPPTQDADLYGQSLANEADKKTNCYCLTYGRQVFCVSTRWVILDCQGESFRFQTIWNQMTSREINVSDQIH